MSENILHSTTQKFLDIFDITNNMVILKDGTCSLIIQVDAMNFGLLAEEEQDSIMYAYAGLLNSLNYPIQIIVHSQTKDVTGYLQILKEQEDEASSRNQQQRIRRYREFVSNLIRERNVLDKKFYVAISAEPIEVGILAASSVIPGQSATASISPEQRTAVIEKARNLLEPKRDHLLAQFARIGLFARQLATQEIIQFFYVSYNPEAAEGQQISDTSNYTTPLVTAGVEGVTMNDAQTPIANQPTPVAEAAAAQQPVPVAPALEQQPVPEAAMPSPTPEPATIPPQLRDTPVVTPIAADITTPAATPAPAPAPAATTPQSSGYTPTQMPAVQVSTPMPAPVETSQPTPAMTETVESPTPTPISTPAPALGMEPMMQPTDQSSSVATPTIAPEPTTPIDKPETTPVSPVEVEETKEPEAITEAEQTQAHGPVPEAPKEPVQPVSSNEKPPIQGPTLASTTGISDLPKPTLPNTITSGSAIINTSTETDSVAEVTEASPEPKTETIEPAESQESLEVEEVPADTTPKQENGDDLPPLPEI